MKNQTSLYRFFLIAVFLGWMTAIGAQGIITAPKNSQKSSTATVTHKKTATAKKTTTSSQQKSGAVSTSRKSSSGSSQKKVHSEAAGYDFTFTCNVPSAQLFIDGIQSGTASGSRFLKSGSHSIKLTASGYDDLVASIHVGSNSQSVNLTMVPRKSFVSSSVSSSSSAGQLQSFLCKPVGILQVDLQSASYSTVESAMKRNFSLNRNSSAGSSGIVYFDENASLSNITYCGLPFRYFRIDKYGDDRCGFLYVFEIQKSRMTRDMFEYLDLIVADFRSLGIPLSYNRKNEEYDKAYGKVFYNGRDYIVSITDYNVCVQYEIRVR